MVNLIESFVIASQMATAVFPKYDSGSTFVALPAHVARAPSSIDVIQNDSWHFSPLENSTSAATCEVMAGYSVEQLVVEKLAGKKVKLEVPMRFPNKDSDIRYVHTNGLTSVVDKSVQRAQDDSIISAEDFAAMIAVNTKEAPGFVVVGTPNPNEVTGFFATVFPSELNDTKATYEKIAIHLQTQVKNIKQVYVVYPDFSISACGDQDVTPVHEIKNIDLVNDKGQVYHLNQTMPPTVFYNGAVYKVFPEIRNGKLYGVEVNSGKVLVSAVLDDRGDCVWSSDLSQALNVKQQDSSPVNDGSIIVGGGALGILVFILLKSCLPKRKRPRSAIDLTEGTFEENCARQSAFEVFVTAVLNSIDHENRGKTTAEIAREIETGIKRH